MGGSTTSATTGSLGIRQRRSWRTWHLVVAIVVALLVGMAIGNTGGSSAPKPITPGYKLPPSGSGAGSSSTTTAPSASSTTAPPASSATTQASSPSTSGPPTTAASATEQVLVPLQQGQGAWNSQPFTVGAAGWSIGWGYRCAAANGSAVFEVFVVPTGSSTPGTPVVSESAAEGTAVTTQNATGSEMVEVRSASGCAWQVKVTGVP